jgi:putative NADH-flavin reductase
MMKISIFGGTGRTGKLVVKEALAKGYEVTVLARDPQKLNESDPKLTVVKGDITDPAAVKAALAGCQVVISALGPTDNKPTFAVSSGIAHILKAMDEQKIRRLIMTAGAGVGDPNDAPKFFNKVMNFMLKAMAKNVLEDMSRAVELVRSSDLDWTVVRLPMLTDDPAKGTVKVAYVGKGMGSLISRADIATFLVSQVGDKTYLQQSPAISN